MTKNCFKCWRERDRQDKDTALKGLRGVGEKPIHWNWRQNYRETGSKQVIK